MQPPMVTLYMGRPLAELSKEELIEAVRRVLNPATVSARQRPGFDEPRPSPSYPSGMIRGYSS